jgi:hypothetical protein
MGDGDQAVIVTDTGALIQETKDRRDREEVMPDIGHITKTLENLGRLGMFPHDTLPGMSHAQLAMVETTLLTLMNTILEKPVVNLKTQEKQPIPGHVKIIVESAPTQETKLEGYCIRDFCHKPEHFSFGYKEFCKFEVSILKLFLNTMLGNQDKVSIVNSLLQEQASNWSRTYLTSANPSATYNTYFRALKTQFDGP